MYGLLRKLAPTPSRRPTMTDYEKWLATPFHMGLEDGEYWTPLCGAIHADRHYCYVAQQMFIIPNACPDCLAHPDYPLYLLGDF